MVIRNLNSGSMCYFETFKVPASTHIHKDMQYLDACLHNHHCLEFQGSLWEVQTLTLHWRCAIGLDGNTAFPTSVTASHTLRESLFPPPLCPNMCPSHLIPNSIPVPYPHLFSPSRLPGLLSLHGKVLLPKGLQSLLWEAAGSFPHVQQSQAQLAPRWTHS